MAVLGSEPEIYFHARLRSATGYIYMYDLMALTPYAETMQLEMMREIETARPRWLVSVEVPTSWARTMNSKRAVLDWRTDYERRFYDLWGRVWLMPDGTAEYFWGADAAKRPGAGAMPVSILVRKPGM
jgi:hypothetical protein